MSEQTEEIKPGPNNGHGQIYGLMADVLAEVQAIAKGRRNEQQNYAFRGIDDIYGAVHPLFAKHKIFTLPRVLSEDTSERVTQSGTVLRFVKLLVAYDFFAPDGSHVTAEVIGEAMDAGDKASNKAMSAAQKYALIQTLCIPTGATPDADETTHDDIKPESRQVSRSTTAPQKCPKCGGDMWDNSQTKTGRQPDYKCKDRECRGAVWLDNEQAKTNRRVMIQSAADGFRLLNELKDSTIWTPRTVKEYVAENFEGVDGVDALDEPQLSALLKMIDARLAGLKAPKSAPKAKVLTEKDAKEEGERQAMLKAIGEADAKEVERQRSALHGTKPLAQLTLDQLVQLHESLDSIPF